MPPPAQSPATVSSGGGTASDTVLTAAPSTLRSQWDLWATFGLSETGQIAHHAGVAGERCSGPWDWGYGAAEALPVAQGALSG